jgi:glycosyltransferase involved in cell wall biosynthesis
MVIQAVIELRKTLPDVTLTVFGEGELRTELDQLIRTSGAATYISLSGFVAKETLFATLCNYDAFVLPSISEAFGLVFLEAMSAGLPVVGFNFGGPADIIAPGVNGLLVKRDELGELVEALRLLGTTPNLAAELGEAAQLTVSQRFGWDTIAMRYLAAYRTVLSRRPNAPLGDRDLR